MNRPILHENLPLIEVSDPLDLDALYTDLRAAQYLLTRIGPTIAVVAPGEIDNLLARLRKLGHTPKVMES
jgi:hypothetical protein